MKRSKEEIKYDIQSGSRICSQCGIRKLFSNYSRDNRSPDNVRKICKECVRKNTNVKKKRLSEQEIEFNKFTQSKVCVVCNIRKSFSKFHNSSVTKDGKNSRCISCDIKARKEYRSRNKEPLSVRNRLADIERKYNLKEEDLRSMMDIRRGCCDICGNSLIDIGESTKQYAIDHNHDTGEVRGLLCLHCNAMLGQAKDSIEILQRGIDYLISKGSYGKE